MNPAPLEPKDRVLPLDQQGLIKDGSMEVRFILQNFDLESDKTKAEMSDLLVETPQVRSLYSKLNSTKEETYFLNQETHYRKPNVHLIKKKPGSYAKHTGFFCEFWPKLIFTK